jgi:hypothetical protein
VERLAPVPVFFALRVASALLLLKLSASSLSVGGFTAFAQFMLFAALLNLMAIGGAQNGLVRQAAAARDAPALARTHTAALLLWACAAPMLAVPTLIFNSGVAAVLVGAPRQGWAVVAITLATLATGPAQIWCSFLTGRKRPARSLAAQALGLLAGTAGATSFILHGEPAAAAIAFAAGGLFTLAAAFVFVAPLRIPVAPLKAAMPELRVLLGYSAALAGTTGFTSIVLFALRSLYRDAFGTPELGYWLAANRISDMSTQLLGLFMIQAFVPHIAAAQDPAARRRVVLGCWAAGVAGMAGIATAFSLAAQQLVRLFLSNAYLTAIPSIQLYMAGDVLRVWPSLAMYTAFAAGRPAHYAGIEIGALSLMAVITAALVAAREPMAPQLAYVGAYGAAAILVTLVFLRRELADRFGRFPGRAPARQVGR